MWDINSFFIKCFASKVGIDEFGNEYYQRNLKKISNNGLAEKRYVIYLGRTTNLSAGGVNSSKNSNKPLTNNLLPPMWHAWLHYITNAIPTQKAHHKGKNAINEDSAFSKSYADKNRYTYRKLFYRDIIWTPYD